MQLPKQRSQIRVISSLPVLVAPVKRERSRVSHFCLNEFFRSGLALKTTCYGWTYTDRSSKIVESIRVTSKVHLAYLPRVMNSLAYKSQFHPYDLIRVLKYRSILEWSVRGDRMVWKAASNFPSTLKTDFWIAAYYLTIESKLFV